MDKWLTVSEAAVLAQKSESAIKRLIYKLQKKEPTSTKKQDGKNYIKESAVLNSLHKKSTKKSDHRTTKTNEQRTSSEQSNGKQYKEFLNIITKQLDEKDKQIESLLIQADQKNKLIAHLQTQLKISPPANDHERPATKERTNSEREPNKQQNVIFGLLILIFVVVVFVLLTVI